jgi:hypothetical protein
MATNPETGTVSYTYDPDGNVAGGPAKIREDVRGE